MISISDNPHKYASSVSSIGSMLSRACRVMLLPVVGAMLIASCDNAKVPAEYTGSQKSPVIYPDYNGVTVPVNIAPLSFELMDGSDNMVARYSFGDEEIVCGDGVKAEPDIDDWKELAARAKGKAIKVEVYGEKDGKWTLYKPFSIYVSPDSIDPYISYRLISPGYVTYEELTINQRCLENYDESVIYDNMLNSEEKTGQCINCHNYQNYNPQRLQFHARQNHGGTMIAYDGKLTKVNMKNDSTISAGVYPSWHPKMKLIAYSTNLTEQSFHTKDANKIEVVDSKSDVIVYDIDRNEVIPVACDSTEMEVFPCWSPDGQWLYYCTAHFDYNDSLAKDEDVIVNAYKIKYSIVRKHFDMQTRRFGPAEMVFDAAAIDKSATLPRISPDGRFLLFGLGGWGCFHIWHRDADLWLQDLKTRKAWPLTAANSPEAESYHEWSSNGRWIIFSSRRTDGNYTRPFIAHIDANGKASKAFELPQRDPDYHRQLMKSYNVTVFMRGPVTISPQEFAKALRNDNIEPAKYAGGK